MKNIKFGQLDVVNARFIYDTSSNRIFVFAKDSFRDKKVLNSLEIIADAVFGVKNKNRVFGIIDITKDQCISSAHCYLCDKDKTPTDDVIARIDRFVDKFNDAEEMTLCSGRMYDLQTGLLLDTEALPLFVIPKGQTFPHKDTGFLVDKTINKHSLRGVVKTLGKMRDYFRGA